MLKGQLNSLARPLLTKQMLDLGNVWRCVELLIAWMRRGWRLSPSFWWQTLSTGGRGCNNWCRHMKSMWHGLPSERGSWRNISRTVRSMSERSSSLHSNRELWLCRPILIGLSIWRGSTRYLSWKSESVGSLRAYLNMSYTGSWCHSRSKNFQFWLSRPKQLSS